MTISLVSFLFINLAILLLFSSMIVLSVKLHSLLLKRLLDITFAYFGIVLALPLIALIALIVKLDSKGPVFVSSRRIGKYGNVFSRYKFRTLYNATPTSMDMSACFALDSCLTRIGRYLHTTGIDELPELFNILKGDITLSEHELILNMRGGVLRTIFGGDPALSLPVDFQTPVIIRLLCLLNPTVFVTYAWYLSEKREALAQNSGRIYIAACSCYYITELLFTECCHLAQSFLMRAWLLVIR